MIDIRYIKEQPDEVIERLAKKGKDAREDVAAILRLDGERRALIAETEAIKAEQDEIDAKVAEQAKSVGKETEEYKKSMDPKQFDYIANEIVVDKLFKFLTENNEFVKKA